VDAADIQDRDGGVLVMATLFGMYPFLLKLYADGGYQGPQFQGALLHVVRHVNVEIVKRSDVAKGFIVLPLLCPSFCQLQGCPGCLLGFLHEGMYYDDSAADRGDVDGPSNPIASAELHLPKLVLKVFDVRLPNSLQAHGFNAFSQAQEGCLHVFRQCGAAS
jgi:hypothetical protein